VRAVRPHRPPKFERPQNIKYILAYISIGGFNFRSLQPVHSKTRPILLEVESALIPAHACPIPGLPISLGAHSRRQHETPDRRFHGFGFLSRTPQASRLASPSRARHHRDTVGNAHRHPRQPASRTCPRGTRHPAIVAAASASRTRRPTAHPIPSSLASCNCRGTRPLAKVRR